MELQKSRFNINIIFYLIAGLSASYLISLVLLQLFAALLFILWLFEKNKLKSFDTLLYLVLGFGGVRLISVFFSEYFDSSLVAIQKELLFYTTIIATFYYIKTFSRREISKLIEIFIHFGTIVAIIGFVLYSMGKYHRAQSFGSGYATFSTYLVVVLVFILSVHNWFKGNKRSLLWIIETALILAGLVLAMGRADLAIGVMLGLAIVFLKRVPIKKIIPAVILSVLLVYVGLQFNPGESAQRMANPTTLSDRDILYQGFFQLADEHPLFGFGPRTFHDIFPLKDKLADKGVGSWHNDYVQTYLESGIFALLILFGLIFTIFSKSNWVILKPKKLMNLGEEKIAIIFGIIALLSSGLTGVFLYSPILSILFAYLISLFSYFCYIQDDFTA